MSDHDQLEKRLRATRASFDEVTIAPDAWQQNQRRLAASRFSRNRRWLAAAAAVAVLLVGGLIALDGREPDTGPPASGISSEDPWAPGNLLGPSVVAEQLTVDGEQVDHEIALSDTDGHGPVLCFRLVAAGSASGGCAAREPGADDPKVAVDWLAGSEGGGDLRGVLAGVDERVASVDVWMSDGERIAADLHPTGWERTQMFALTVPSDGPRPQRLVATDGDGHLLQAVDLATSFGDTWLKARSACDGDPVAVVNGEPTAPGDVSVAVGATDAEFKVISTDGVSGNRCVPRLRGSALAGWVTTGKGLVAVVAPEVATVRIMVKEELVGLVEPSATPGSPFKVAEVGDLADGALLGAELVAYDGINAEIDRVFVNQPASP